MNSRPSWSMELRRQKTTDPRNIRILKDKPFLGMGRQLKRSSFPRSHFSSVSSSESGTNLSSSNRSDSMEESPSPSFVCDRCHKSFARGTCYNSMQADSQRIYFVGIRSVRRVHWQTLQWVVKKVVMHVPEARLAVT